MEKKQRLELDRNSLEYDSLQVVLLRTPIEFIVRLCKVLAKIGKHLLGLSALTSNSSTQSEGHTLVYLS